MLFNIDLELISNNYYYLLIILLIIFNDKYIKYINIIQELIISKDRKKIEELIIKNYKQTSDFNKNEIKKIVNDFNKKIDIKNYELNKYNPDINSYYLYNIILYLLQSINLKNSIQLFYEYYNIHNEDDNIIKDIDILNKKNRIDNYFKIILFSLLLNSKTFNLLFNNIINDLNLLLKKEDYIIIKYLYIINYNKIKLINKILENIEDEYFITNIINIDNPIIYLIFNKYIKYLDISSDKNEKKYINNIIKSILYILKDNKTSSKTQEKLDYISSNINKINYLLNDTIILINSIKNNSTNFNEEIIKFCEYLIEQEYDFFKPKKLTIIEQDKKLGTYERDLLNQEYKLNLDTFIKEIEKFTVDDIKLLLLDLSLKLNNNELYLLQDIIKEDLKIKYKSTIKSYVKQITEINDFNIKDLNKYTNNYLLVILNYIFEVYYNKSQISSNMYKYVEYINNIELKIKLKKEILDLYSKLNQVQLNQFNSKINNFIKLFNLNNFFKNYSIILDKINYINIYMYLIYYSTKKINIIENISDIYSCITYNKNILEFINNKLNEFIYDNKEILYNFILNSIILSFIYKYNKSLLNDNNIYNKLFINIKENFNLPDYIAYLLSINNDSIFIDIYNAIIPDNEDDINYLIYRYEDKEFINILEILEVNDYIDEENEEDYMNNKINFIKSIVYFHIQEYLKYKKAFNKDELNIINNTLNNIVLYLETNDKIYLKILSENKINYNLFDLLIYCYNKNNKIILEDSDYTKKLFKIDDLQELYDINYQELIAKLIKKEYYNNNISNIDIIDILNKVRLNEPIDDILRSLNIYSLKGGRLKIKK